MIVRPRATSAARELCDAVGAVLIDEIRRPPAHREDWGCDWEGVVPDLMAVGKAIGSGVMPLAAFVAGELWRIFDETPYTSTFGGNPLACAAGLAALDGSSASTCARRPPSAAPNSSTVLSRWPPSIRV